MLQPQHRRAVHGKGREVLWQVVAYLTSPSAACPEPYVHVPCGALLMCAQGGAVQRQDSLSNAFSPAKHSMVSRIIVSCFDWSYAGVVLAAASKCDTPNVKAVPPPHRGLPRPSTGEPKRQAAGQKSSKGEQPGRLHRAASAEAAQSAASTEAGLAGGRQASAPPAALESAAAQVGIHAEQPLAPIGFYVFTVISCRPLHVDADDHLSHT